MDILNWLYLRKNQLIRKTVSNPAADLVVLGGDATFAKRDDKYKTYAMTVEDFATAVALPPAYKVYTALLTQSGGDVPQGINGDEAIPLTIGVTYEIVDNTGLDVTNVGSPNNNIGTKFVATGTTPNSWGNIDGWAILGYNTGTPVVTVLENTIGNVWFTYEGVGTYYVKSNSLFTLNKTMFVNTSFNNRDNDTMITLSSFLSYGTSNELELVCNDSQNNFRLDGQLNNTPIEIRVYN